MQKTHLQKYNQLLALLSVAFFMMSCETLEFSNPNSPIVDDVSIQSIVTGVEASMRIDWAIYLRVVGIHGRESYYFEPADPRYTGELLNGNTDPGGFLTTRPWTGRYRTIANCRFLLDKNAGPAVDGFAQTIMAYQLLLNLNYMDVNGIKIDYSGDLSIPVASKAQAFAEINRLLDAGNTNLAAGGAAFPFTLSNGLAAFNTPATFARLNRALKARVAVYEGKFQDALTALGASFLDPALPLNLGAYQVYGGGLGDQTNEVYENPDAAFVKLMAHQTFQTEAEAGDQRFATKVKVRTPPTTFEGLTTSLAVTVTSSSTDPLPIIRNEELILLRAEANIGLGQLGAAQGDINLVRAAAGLPAVTLSAANALDQLLYEKRYSLFMEGHRWVDLRRYGRLAQLPTDRAGDVVVSAMPVPETEIEEDGGGGR
ncbi:MAG: RagB/SusD family nutrient uptake outer membrane protein [bacterium]